METREEIIERCKIEANEAKNILMELEDKLECNGAKIDSLRLGKVIAKLEEWQNKK